MSISPKYAANTIGSGKHTVDLYLDYVCPFSAKLFNTVYHDVLSKHDSQVQFVFRHNIQPWHPSSTLVAEAGIAVSLLTQDPAKFWKFSDELFKHQREYFDEPVYNETRPQTYERLAELAHNAVGVDKNKFLELVSVPAGESKNAGNKLGVDVKAFTRFGRQNGVHVTPTVAVDGVIQPDISSSWAVEQWAEKINGVEQASKL